MKLTSLFIIFFFSFVASAGLKTKDMSQQGAQGLDSANIEQQIAKEEDPEKAKMLRQMLEQLNQYKKTIEQRNKYLEQLETEM